MKVIVNYFQVHFRHLTDDEIAIGYLNKENTVLAAQEVSSLRGVIRNYSVR